VTVELFTEIAVGCWAEINRVIIRTCKLWCFLYLFFE